MDYSIGKIKYREFPKPSWEDAPVWANYLAHDICGRWYWFSARPSPFHTSYISYSRYMCVSAEAQEAKVWECLRHPNWRLSLEENPMN